MSKVTFAQKRLIGKVHEIIRRFRFGEEAMNGRRKPGTGHHWIQCQTYERRGFKGAVIVDAFDCINRPFQTLDQMEIESAIINGHALFVVVDYEGYRGDEPLVTHWVCNKSDLAQFERALSDMFALHAVIAVDETLGNDMLPGRTADDSFQVYAMAHPWKSGIMPGCRVTEWTDDVHSQREDVRVLTYPVDNRQGIQQALAPRWMPTAKTHIPSDAARNKGHEAEVIHSRIPHQWRSLRWETITNPDAVTFRLEERGAIMLCFRDMLEDYLTEMDWIRWGKFRFDPKEMAAFVRAYGGGWDAEKIYEAVVAACTGKGVQTVNGTTVTIF